VSAPLVDLAQRYADWGVAGEAVGVRTADALGALLTGAATAEGRAVSSLAGGTDGLDGGGLAAVVRRVAVTRLTELDDIHMPSGTTPGAVVVPTAVTVGARLGASAAAYGRAVEIGYDAMTRLGQAIDGAHAVYRGVWPTYFCAPFAAAAVAAALLDLPAGHIAQALGLALTRATGLTSGIAGAPLGRWLTVGEAARAGCTAALAARAGFVAPVVLERIGQGAGLAVDERALLDDSAPAVESVSVKPFPTAKQSLAATRAALDLRDGLSADAMAQVGRVRVYVPEAYAGMVANPPRADSRLSRMSSARWNVALALAAPDELADVERATLPDVPHLARLMDRIEVAADPGLGEHFPGHWPARVVIDELEAAVVSAPGDPPGNGRAAVEAKWAARGRSPAAFADLDPAALDRALATYSVR
jgi:2-methylcitrate dehydratase PrpD